MAATAPSLAQLGAAHKGGRVWEPPSLAVESLHLLGRQGTSELATILKAKESDIAVMEGFRKRAREAEEKARDVYSKGINMQLHAETIWDWFVSSGRITEEHKWVLRFQEFIDIASLCYDVRIVIELF